MDFAISLGQAPFAAREGLQDSAFGLVQRRCAHPPDTQRHPKARADLFDHRRREPGGAAGSRHPLNPASPLLDETERMEDAPDDPVAQLRDPSMEIVYREAKGQKPRVLHLQTVVEDGHADGRAARSPATTRSG